jgi:hypothetical protein
MNWLGSRTEERVETVEAISSVAWLSARSARWRASHDRHGLTLR